VREGESEFVGSSRMCFRLRKRHGAREQLLASRRHVWRLGRRRRDVEKQGEVQRGPRSSGRGAGAARGVEKGGAGQQELGTCPARAAGSGREKNRERGDWR
jgi:hypothetical protein